MGSPKVSNAKPQMPMDKKSIKTPFLSSFKRLFTDKKKDKAKCEKEIEKPKPQEKQIQNEKPDTVANILKGIENLAIKQEEKKKEEAKCRKNSETEEDEFRNFNFKVLEDDRRRHSSEDSGFSEGKEDFAAKDDQEVINSFVKLKIEGEKDDTKEEEDEEKHYTTKKEEDEDKKKKVQVFVSRAPIRNKVSDYNVDPYAARQVNHQVNKQILSGGQVFVANTPDTFTEVDIALKQFEKQSQSTINQSEFFWEDINDVIDTDALKTEALLKDLQLEKPEDFLREFKDFVAKEPSLCIDAVSNVVSSNPIEEFTTASHNLPYEDTIDLNNALLSIENAADYSKMDSIFPTSLSSETVPLSFDNGADYSKMDSIFSTLPNSVTVPLSFENAADYSKMDSIFPTPPRSETVRLNVDNGADYSKMDSIFPNPPRSETVPLSFENGADYSKTNSIFPTPPRSENVPSPMSESQTSFYTQNWENSLSPERSSPIYNSDYEKYQDIAQYEELSPISDKDEKKRERTNSLSSMTMKNFKDMMKDITNEFSKKDCCQMNRKPCKELFDEHMTKLKAMERKSLCFKVSKMDLKTACGILHHILLAASSKQAAGSEQADMQNALFVLICQRILGQRPALFYAQFGLDILKLAVMRCPHRPLLTRFIVHYVYAALHLESSAAAQECIFHEVDAQGDNLVIACARAGDAYALVLAEITRLDVRGDLPPLFRIHHANADGYTALHVACSQHSASSPRLHTQHVLLEHAQADLWKGDVKGGDTALHLAVNSATCDLRAVMMIFKQLDRKLWKKLAHCQNMSSVTPLEYARSATKSTTRLNYPQEVLDFLKKCR